MCCYSSPQKYKKEEQDSSKTYSRRQELAMKHLEEQRTSSAATKTVLHLWMVQYSKYGSAYREHTNEPASEISLGALYHVADHRAMLLHSGSATIAATKATLHMCMAQYSCHIWTPNMAPCTKSLPMSQ